MQQYFLRNVSYKCTYLSHQCVNGAKVPQCSKWQPKLKYQYRAPLPEASMSITNSVKIEHKVFQPHCAVLNWKASKRQGLLSVKEKRLRPAGGLRSTKCRQFFGCTWDDSRCVTQGCLSNNTHKWYRSLHCVFCVSVLIINHYLLFKICKWNTYHFASFCLFFQDIYAWNAPIVAAHYHRRPGSIEGSAYIRHARGS